MTGWVIAEPVRVAEVAISAPALAHQWARQEKAPGGSAVIAFREVAGRQRGGVEWLEPDAVAVSVVARPADLAPSASDVGWLAAGLATADALTTFQRSACPEPSLWWPDGIETVDGSTVADCDFTVSVLAESLLGPGRVDYVILTARIASPQFAGSGGKHRVAGALVETLRHWADLLDHPDDVKTGYQSRCATIGEVVTVSLSLHGSTRGTAVAITDNAALILRSPTGLDEVITVADARSVEKLAL